MSSSTSSVIIVIILLCVILPQMQRRKRFVYHNILKKDKGESRMLPKEMIKEFVGKVCYVNVFDASVTSYTRILEIEDNWIKVKDNNGIITMINGDMVKSIQLAAEKHQSKCQ